MRIRSNGPCGRNGIRTQECSSPQLNDAPRTDRVHFQGRLMADHRTSRAMTDDASAGSESEGATYGVSSSATSVPPPEPWSVPRFLADASQQLAVSLDYEDTLVAVAGMALPYLGSWCIVDIAEQDGSMRRLGVIHPDPRKAKHARRLEDSWPPDRDDPIGVPRAIRSRATELIPGVPDETLVEVAKSE